MMEGVLNIDKPLGHTSHDVVAQVRRVSGQRRVGHAGTLDPLATGVLVVCLGRTTRLIEYLVGRAKTYEARIHFGQSTDTYDAEGEITAEYPVPPLTLAQIQQSLTPFRGDIQQIPPLYSALKKGGQPLYKWARQGKQVDLVPRPVTIYQLDLVAWEPPHLALHIVCGAGTYIRSLAHDLGQQIGCGGHLAQLRRTAVGPFTAESTVPLAALSADNLMAHLQPPDCAVRHLPRLDLTETQANALYHGRPIEHPSVAPPATLARAYGPHGRLAGIVQAEATQWQPKKMFLPE